MGKRTIAMKRKPGRIKEVHRKRRVTKILAIVRKGDSMPRTWTKGRSAWISHVAAIHNVAVQSIYRWMKKYNQRGIAGLEHRKSNVGEPKAWTPAALNWWIGQALLPANRKIDLRSLYKDVLIIEAQRRGWHIGCWSSAAWWLREKSRSMIENNP